MFRRPASLLAVAAALGALSLAPGMSQPAPIVTMNSPRQAKRGLFGGVGLAPSTQWGYGGPGTTMAQQKRAAKKRRNVKRHKAACRG